MNLLLKISRNNCLQISSKPLSILTKNTLIDTTSTNQRTNQGTSTALTLLDSTSSETLINKRSMYTFRLSNRIVRNTHATRPRKTKNNSVELTYEQSQFAEKIGVTKSWNSWNTCK